jgi:hypothetical protein
LEEEYLFWYKDKGGKKRDKGVIHIIPTLGGGGEGGGKRVTSSRPAWVTQ